MIAAFLCISSNNKTVLSFKDAISSQEKFQIVEGSSSKDIAVKFKEAGFGFIIFQAFKQEEVSEVLKIFELLAPIIKKSHVKILGFIPNGTAQLEKYLMKKGCTEILNEGLNLRALNHKMDRWIKIVEKTQETSKEVSDSTEVKDQKNTNSSQTQNENETPAPVEWIESVNLKSDCWLVSAKESIKKSWGKWIVHMYGPGPGVGIWKKVPVDPALSKGEVAWAFVERAGDPLIKNEPFICEKGDWIFVGRRPEFSWETRMWIFVSPQPFFAFFNNDRPEAIKFDLRGDLLNFARNPPYSEEMAQKILATVQTEDLIDKRDRQERGEDTTFGFEQFKGTGNDYLNKAKDPSKELSGTFERDQHEGGLINDQRGEDAANEPTRDWIDELKSVGLFVEIEGHPSEEPITLIDLFESEITLRSKRLDLKLDQTVRITLSLTKAFPTIRVNATATVMAIEEDPASTSFLISFVLKDFDSVEFEKFQNVFVNRQEVVGDFLKTAKGW